MVVPALTPDLLFSLLHWREMYQIEERHDKKSGTQLLKYVEGVLERAGLDARNRIDEMTMSITEQLKEKLRISWRPRNVEQEWGNWGYVRKSHGRARTLGWVGIYFDAGAGYPRIVLTLSPVGGVSGRGYLLERCRSRWPRLVLPQDDSAHFPGFELDPSILFHSKRLNARTTLAGVVTEAGGAARKFLSMAMPYLEELSGSPRTVERPAS